MMIPPPSASSSQHKHDGSSSSRTSRSLGVHKCYFLVTVIVAVAVLLLLNTTVGNISNTPGTILKMPQPTLHPNQEQEQEQHQLPASLSNNIQPSSLQDDVSGNDLDLDINYTALLQKWKLPVSADAVAVLHEIRTKPKFQYDPRQDILGFHHPLKSGGTSLSLMLQELVGGNHAVMPGSGASGWFNFKKFEQAMQQYPPPPPSVVASPTITNKDVMNTTNTTAAAAVASYEYWNNISVLYTHSYLRPNPSMNNSTKRGYIFQYLRTQVPQLAKKRFRLLTLVRRPVDLAASRFSETTCRVMSHTPGMKKAKTPAECPVVNLTDVAAQLKRNGKKPYTVCQSIDHFIASKHNHVHNQYYKTIMGAEPKPPSQLPQALEERTIEKNPHQQNPTDPVATTTNDTAFTTSTITADAAAITHIAVQTLRDLGGLLPYNTQTQEEDFVWFGITERFTESMCVFYYTFYPHFNYTRTNEKKNR